MNALARNPQQMFGVLITLEMGVDPMTIAERVGGGLNAMLDMVEAARAGHLPRQGYWKGERMASEVLAERGGGSTKGQELFLAPWHRVAVQLIARPEGALSGELHAVIEQFDMSHEGTKLILRLRSSIERAGFAVLVENNVRGRESRYQMPIEDRRRMAEVIANGWVAP